MSSSTLRHGLPVSVSSLCFLLLPVPRQGGWHDPTMCHWRRCLSNCMPLRPCAQRRTPAHLCPTLLQAPDAMRSTCAALMLLASALGSYLAAALVSIVQVRPAA